MLTAGALLLGPAYGWVLDKHSAPVALVMAISLCGAEQKTPLRSAEKKRHCVLLPVR